MKNAKDVAEMSFIPGGSFLMGTTAKEVDAPLRCSASDDYRIEYKTGVDGNRTSAVSGGKTGFSEAEVAECNAVDARTVQIDPGLRLVALAWPSLSEADRKAVLMIVRRAVGNASGESGNVAAAD